MGAFKEYAFGGGSIGSYKPMADLGDTPANLHAAAEKKITQSDLDQIEKYADRLFASLDIDVEFTRHFMDRVNDARNIKQITVAELIRLFKQAYRRHGKKIAKLPDQANAVINDMKTNINLPFVLKYKKGEIEWVAKTVMRKKNFTTSASSPKLSFESLQHKLDEAFPVQVTVKDKKGKTHTIGTRDLRGATHALLIHYKEIPPVKGDLPGSKETKPAKTEIFLGTESELAKTAKRMLKQHPSKKYATGAEVVKLDQKMVKGATLEEVELDEVATGDFAPVAHQLSLAELIFDSAGYGSDMSATSTVRGGPGSVANNMWLPLSGSIFNRALPKEVRATVYHVTRMSNFDQLYAIQDSNRSISTFANMDRGPIAGGVQGGSGLVVEVDGNVLAASREDLFTIPEKSGRRLMAFNWFRGPWGSDDVVKMAKGLERLLKTLVNKYGKSFDGKTPKGKGDWEKWEYMRGAYVKAKSKGDRSAGRVMQKIVKDYMDGVEKVFKQNAKQVQATLTNYVKRRKTDDNWDEIVVDDFNIKKVWIIIDSDELNPGDAEAFKEMISLTKIPVETIDSQDMEALVRYEAQLATGRS